MVILKTSNLGKVYGEGSNAVRALSDVNLTVDEGEFVAIVGASGSGKSTLLHMLGGIDVPTEGKVIISGKALSIMSQDELTIFRRKNVGFIFQNYNLLPILNVYDNIVLPVELDGAKMDKGYLNKVIDLLGLSEKKDFLPNHLSGGQQQRVAIARALAMKPSIVLADEPTGNLDSKTSESVMELLKMTSSKFKQTVIMITHNDEIARLADRIIRIQDGKICSSMRGDSHAM